MCADAQNLKLQMPTNLPTHPHTHRPTHTHTHTHTHTNKDIVLYGESLGTGVAIELASKDNFGGIILESPFTSMADTAKIYYPYLPVNLLLKDRYDSKNKIKDKFKNFPSDFSLLEQATAILKAAVEDAMEDNIELVLY